MRFKKKPVIIEAIQLTDRNKFEVCEFCKESNVEIEFESTSMVIRTLEGNMVADIGDWVIKGIKGEFYPCKPDIFEMTYEKVKENIWCSE